MSQQKIIVCIAADGKTTVEPIGFVGPTCQSATKKLEDALGIVVQSEKKESFDLIDLSPSTTLAQELTLENGF